MNTYSKTQIKHAAHDLILNTLQLKMAELQRKPFPTELDKLVYLEIEKQVKRLAEFFRVQAIPGIVFKRAKNDV